MNTDLLLLGFYAVAAVVGLPFVVKRMRRDKERQGQLSVHDGQLLKAPEKTPASRVAYSVGWHQLSQDRRVTIDGVDMARVLGFRIEGLTHRTSGGLSGRLAVDGTKGSARARRLFDRTDVREALVVVCGSHASFRRIDLFPGGQLAVVVSSGKIEDLTERLLRFAEVLDRAVPQVEQDDDIDLGSTSGSTSSAAFSIEIRS